MKKTKKEKKKKLSAASAVFLFCFLCLLLSPRLPPRCVVEELGVDAVGGELVCFGRERKRREERRVSKGRPEAKGDQRRSRSKKKRKTKKKKKLFLLFFTLTYRTTDPRMKTFFTVASCRCDLSCLFFLCEQPRGDVPSPGTSREREEKGERERERKGGGREG